MVSAASALTQGKTEEKTLYKFIHWHTGQHVLQAPSTKWLLTPVLLNSKVAQEKYAVKKGNTLPTRVGRSNMEKGTLLASECANAVPSSILLLLTPVCIWFALTYISNLFYYYFREMFQISLWSKIKALLHRTVINTGWIMYIKASISAWIPVMWSWKDMHSFQQVISVNVVKYKEGKIFISAYVSQRSHGDRHGSDMLLSQSILGILFHVCFLSLVKSALAFVSGSRSWRGPRPAPVLVGACTGSFN